LVGGDDDYLVNETALRHIRGFLGRDDEQGPDLEILQAEGVAAADVLALLGRLEGALQSPSLFAARRIIWVRDFGGLSRGQRPKSEQVGAVWKRLAAALKSETWPTDTGLVISGPPMDRSLGFVKAAQARGVVLTVGGDARGRGRAEGAGAAAVIDARLRDAGKRMAPAARRRFIGTVGNDARRVASEIDKLIDYVGDTPDIGEDDVRAISSPGVEPPVWDLADAFGERRLDDALRLVGRFLDRGESPMALLGGLVQRVRLMLAVKGLVAEGQLRPDDPYPRFKSRVDALPDTVRDVFPADRRLNPFAQHPFVLYKVAGQAAGYSASELERAMHLLVDANRDLVTGGSGRAHLVFQTAMVRILRS
jgi:DNA polymerase III delta subunit